MYHFNSFKNYRICKWGEWMSSALSTFNTTTPNTQLLPGCRSTGCPLLRVCVHGLCVCSLLCVCALGWVKCRARILSMGHHTWLYVTSHINILGIPKGGRWICSSLKGVKMEEMLKTHEVRQEPHPSSLPLSLRTFTNDCPEGAVHIRPCPTFRYEQGRNQ